MAFIELNKLLSIRTGKSGLRKQVNVALALERADAVLRALLGEDAKDHFRPVYVQYRYLTIACSSAAAAAALGRIESDILDYVNKGFEQSLVDKLKVIQ